MEVEVAMRFRVDYSEVRFAFTSFTQINANFVDLFALVIFDTAKWLTLEIDPKPPIRRTYLSLCNVSNL